MLIKAGAPQAASESRLLNRELGILEFNRRVLAQAEDKRVPALERLRFLGIVSSNLDEFFEVRVGGLKEQIKLDIPGVGPDGLSAREVFARVSVFAHALVQRQYELFQKVIVPELAREGIRFLRRAELTDAQRAWIRGYFEREMLPVLTPIGLDPAHPFPRVFNKSLNFAVELEGRDAFGRPSTIAILKVPRALPRVIPLPAQIAGGKQAFVMLTSVIRAHLE
ncbi:MAG: RNA degradosome polyphosphate kinase, partial [Burkholderiales bacterium]|nr:RNA degradosome polyphosphate kinase [Burkholderiales bacterium]